MSNSLSLEYDVNVRKEIITQQLAELYGLNREKVYDNYWDNRVNKAPELNFHFIEDHHLKNFIPEEYGFKSNIDGLDRWTDEEANRHLIRNIFCFR